MQLVRNSILPAATTVTAGHLAMLKSKVLTALMRRLDSSLFEKFLGGMVLLHYLAQSAAHCVSLQPDAVQQGWNSSEWRSREG